MRFFLKLTHSSLTAIAKLRQSHDQRSVSVRVVVVGKNFEKILAVNNKNELLIF